MLYKWIKIKNERHNASTLFRIKMKTLICFEVEIIKYTNFSQKKVHVSTPKTWFKLVLFLL